MGSEMGELFALRREVEALRDALEAMRGALASDAGVKIIELAKLTYSERMLLGLLMRRHRSDQGSDDDHALCRSAGRGTRLENLGRHDLQDAQKVEPAWRRDPHHSWRRLRAPAHEPRENQSADG